MAVKEFQLRGAATFGLLLVVLGVPGGALWLAGRAVASPSVGVGGPRG